MADPAPITVEIRVELRAARVPAEDLARAKRGELTLVLLAPVATQKGGPGAIEWPCEWCSTPCWVMPATTAMRRQAKEPTVAVCSTCIQHALLTPPAKRS